MIAFASMLMNPAKTAGIKVPPDANTTAWDEYPHWCVYCAVQLCRRMPSADSHWRNAEVIAQLSEAEIRTITPEQLEERGFR